MALVVGVTGVGIYSQVINISNLMAVLIPIGSLGITRYISEFYEDKKTAQISLLLRKILTINIPVVFIISILLIVFSRTFSQLLYSDNSYWLLITMYAVSIPLGLISSLIDIYLKSVRIVSLYVKFVAIGSITSLIVFIPLVYYYKIEGASSSFIFTYLVSIIVGLLILKKNRILPNLKVSEQLDPDVLKKIYRTGFIMIVIYMFQQLSNIVIRSLIAKSLSLHELGIYQSVYAISNNYFALFFTIIYTYSFPKFSTFKTNEEIIQETNETLKFLVLVYTPLVIIFFVFRMFFIRLLYSSEFLFAKELLFYQLLGDFLKMLSWVFAIWLIPNFKLKAWALFDIIFFQKFIKSFVPISKNALPKDLDKTPNLILKFLTLVDQ